MWPWGAQSSELELDNKLAKMKQCIATLEQLLPEIRWELESGTSKLLVQILEVLLLGSRSLGRLQEAKGQQQH